MKTLCPVSGFEWTFEDHSKIFNDNIEGGNCYSYALNHPEPNGKRDQKSVPGDITKKKYPFTDWQSCGEAVKRILDDGKTVGKMYGVPTVVKKLEGSLSEQMASHAPPEFRKFLLVVETNEEKKGTPTDFHFYAQNKMMVDQMYNSKLVGTGKSKFPNYYNKLHLNAFCSKVHINRAFRNHNNNNGNNAKIYKMLQNHRGYVNVMLHESIIPEYALHFIIDPWWMLDIGISKRTRAEVMRRVGVITKKIQSVKLSKKRTERCMKILDFAKKECFALISNKKKLMNKSTIIGLWSHKLGWGTKPLNTDGNMKLLFNPVLACRDHGSYDYDKACQAFIVRTGYGHSSA